MTELSFAGWAVQERQSPTRKVHAAIVYRDPFSNAIEYFTAHGTKDQWESGRLVLRTPNTAVQQHLSNAESAAQLFKDALHSRHSPHATEHGYDSIVAGPAVVTVDVDALVEPRDLLRALRDAPVDYTTFPARLASTVLAASTQPVNGTSEASAGTLANARIIVDVPADDRDGVLLPNGERYLPRDLAGHPDYLVLRRLRGVVHMRLKGLPGGGKTTLPQAAFGDDLITAQGYGDQSYTSLIGQPVFQDDGTLKWCWGSLARAMMEGKVFLWDDINRSSPETINAILSVADSRGILRVDDRPDLEPIKAEPGFGLIITYNEEGQGVRPLDDAIKRRFPFEVVVETDYDIAQRLGVDNRFCKVGRNLQTKHVESIARHGFPVWRPQMADLLAVQAVLGAGLGDECAVATLVSACTRPEDLQTVQEVIASVFAIENATGLVLGGAR